MEDDRKHPPAFGGAMTAQGRTGFDSPFGFFLQLWVTTTGADWGPGAGALEAPVGVRLVHLSSFAVLIPPFSVMTALSSRSCGSDVVGSNPTYLSSVTIKDGLNHWLAGRSMYEKWPYHNKRLGSSYISMDGLAVRET